jgi:putative transposase
MSVPLVRVYRYCIYPTARQSTALEQQLEACCFLYNAALEQRIRAYREHGTSLGLYDQQRELTQARAAGLLPEGMARKAQVDALVRLDRAFLGFFRRVKGGHPPGFPRFRTISRYESLSWPEGHGAGIKDARLRLQGVGSVRVRWHRPLPPGAEIRTVTVRRSNGRWYVSLALRLATPQSLPPTQLSIGVDRGVAVPFAFSNGELVEGPRARRASAPITRRALRKVARCKAGSNRRKKSVLALARKREAEANRRRDFLHKLSKRSVDGNDLIVLENLNVAGMVRGNRGLNREILDQGWSEFERMIVYKAEWAGRQVIKVNPAYTSQRCAECSVIDKASRSGVRYRCTSCGHEDHADVNAARNILGAGLALQALTMGEEARVV